MEEIVKHPTKVKPFNRKVLMDIAKVIRNTALTSPNRAKVVSALARYFEETDPWFDRQTFTQLAHGVLKFDAKTEPYSDAKELINEITSS